MKNKIVDSHCHLNFDDFKDDLDDVIKNAKDKDVDYMLSISVNLEKFEEIYNLTQKYKNVWCTTGVHPNNVPKKLDVQNITKLKSHLLKNLLKKKVVGIGETGLDYYRSLENKQNQISKADAKKIVKTVSMKSFEGGLKILIIWFKMITFHYIFYYFESDLLKTT